MKNDYQLLIKFNLDEPFDINYIKSRCNQYPNYKILVEVQNTKGITSSMLKQLDENIGIRIAGAYDEERISRYKGQTFGKETTEDYYYNSVIYTRNETIKILEEIEKIEFGINKNWSSIQKLIYIYDRLKTGIMYDPKFEQRFSSEIRSLRGLITKQTVCAGYAVILKEFMDRSNIVCEFARGGTKSGETSGHAWNIVTIDGKKYPIDLTWDNSVFRSGKSGSFEFLGQDVSTFSKRHHPAPGEKTQDYEHTLSQIDPQLLRQIYTQMGVARVRDYSSTTYHGVRNDGSRFIIAQIGDLKKDNTTYFRYYFVEISKDGKKQRPLILYGETNITRMVETKKFGEKLPPNLENVISNVLFSRENIADSISKKTYYIGRVGKNAVGNKIELVSSYQEIPKPQEKRELFTYPTRIYRRSNGSVFIAQQMFDKAKQANGIYFMRYDILEMVNENGKEVLKRNTVYTERNFFKDTRQSMVDDYLSRERIDRKVREAGGYIGYYDENGVRTYNPKLVEYFETSKRIDMDSISKQNQPNNIPIKIIPTFSELKDLASKYEIFIDLNDPHGSDISKIKIRDIKTGQIQTDKSIIDKAIFANIWLEAAGVKVYGDETRPGEKYAFNGPSEELYNTICKELLDSCKRKGVIDTVDLLRKIYDINNYKYNRDIIVKLFRTPYQTEIINKLFLESLGISQPVQTPEALYTMGYAGNLAYGDNEQKRR